MRAGAWQDEQNALRAGVMPARGGDPVQGRGEVPTLGQPEDDAEQRWLRIGLEAHRAGRLLDAEKAYKALLAEMPNSADGLHLSGLLIKEGGGDMNLAAAMIEAALDLHPERAVYWHNLAGVRQSMGDALNAERGFRRALALQPDYVSAWLGLAEVWMATGHPASARAGVDQAISLESGQPAVLVRAAMLLSNLQDVVQAENCYRRAIGLTPDDGGIRGLFSLMLLREGRFDEGWRELDGRLQGGRPQVPLPLADLDRWPRWRGESLAGKRLLLCGEQGFGDVLQFVRYARALHARGATVDVCNALQGMERLLLTAPGVNAVFAAWPDREDYDYWVPMLSVPGIAGTTLETIDADVPYLSADPDRSARWRKRLDELAGADALRVGLVWAGRKTHPNDRYRSMHLADFQPLAEVPGVAWFSLQLGADSAQMGSLGEGWPVHDLGPELTDFAETAAVVENLDLVIAVDTAVAHLAGALDKPAWVLLSAVGVDWRWMRERIDTPWYPSLTLFRQPAPLQWDRVVSAVKARLADLATFREAGTP